MRCQKEHRRILILFVTLLWLFSVGVGLSILWDYETSPGRDRNPPVQWPADSQIQRFSGRATLIMLAHPHCPCTRASIGELALLMARCKDQVAAYVLFFKPTGVADDWETTDLWRSAAAIPGVSALRDDGGAEARRFGAVTSGQTILYDAEGRLLFRGGITGSRGHSGDNAGRSAIVSLLTRGTADRRETFAFGCSLFDTNSECQKDVKACSHRK